MNEPTKNDIELVMNGLKNFYGNMLAKGIFDIIYFKNYMEKIFLQAGYRENCPLGGGNILIIHDGGAGDFVTETATIREIRRLYPKAHITLVVFAAAYQLAETCPYVDELISNSRSFQWLDIPASYRWNMDFARQLLERRFDICFTLTCWAETALLAYMSGTKIQIASVIDCPKDKSVNGEQKRFFQNFATDIAPTENCKHIVDMYLSSIDNLLKMPVADRSLELWTTPADNRIAKNFIGDAGTKNLFAVAFGGSALTKHYPPEKYAQVLQMIVAEEADAKFILLGAGQNDVISAETVKQFFPKFYAEHIIDLTNKLNYRQSAAILRCCKMYIGNDTGMMHVAEAMKLPCLVQFSFPADLPTDSHDAPRRLYPYNVPTVVILPAHALPECAADKSYNSQGCKVSDKPHCIATIEPETIFKGYKILQDRIIRGLTAPFYLY